MIKLNFFFEPESIAIIGASEAFKFGRGTTKYLLESNFVAYPVSLTRDTIFEHEAFKNIMDIPDNIDLAVILVGNENVLQAIKDCVKKGVKGVIIETAGFAETGIEKFIMIQEEIKDIAKNHNMRIIGPNCVGITNFINKFTTTEIEFESTIKGGISVVAQSGVLGNIFMDWAGSQKIGFSKSITLGNKIDVDEIDMIEYLQDDPTTNVITLYLEGVKRGLKFLECVKNTKKPIIILKNGRSKYGENAMKSHTGSIAGNDKIYNAIFEQNAGIFRVNNFYEMFNIAQVFSTQPLPKGKRIAIITGSGSLGILACDEIEKKGLLLAKFEEETTQSMKEVAPNWVSLKNPVDLGPSMATTLMPSIKAVFKDKNVDSVLFILSIPQAPLKAFSMTFTTYLRRLNKMSRKFEKPSIICVFGSRWFYKLILRDASNLQIPVMSRIKHAIKALKMMNDFREYLEKDK